MCDWALSACKRTGIHIKRYNVCRNIAFQDLPVLQVLELFAGVQSIAKAGLKRGFLSYGYDVNLDEAL